MTDIEFTSDQQLIAAYGDSPKVACCVCGVPIDANPSNMCGNCIRSHVDIARDLVKDYIIVYCPECERYLQPPKYWSRAPPESRELMTICLKKIKALNKYTLVDASFIWTEAHSKRLRLKLTLQQELFSNTVIQQQAQIEYEILWQQCPTCQKAATGQPQWDAVVQLRQKVTHRRTFLHLEQLILKHRMQEDVTRIESQPDGLDFFYGHKSQAQSFVDFLAALAPLRRTDAVQLVSHDSKSNTAVRHHTVSLEIAPLCREDLVILPKMYYGKLGSLGPVVLVHKVYSSIVFLDPCTLRAGEITGSLYWKHPFAVHGDNKVLTDFYVIDVTPTGVVNGKLVQATATVCLESEVGTGREWIVNTHLGALLNPGDLAKGYLLSALNVSLDEEREEFINKLRGGAEEVLPDVVLVRKHFPAQLRNRRKRQWKLHALDVEEPATQTSKDRAAAQAERDEYADEIERDAELRRDVPVYKDNTQGRRQVASTTESQQQQQEQQGSSDGGDDAAGEDDEGGAPTVELSEMIDELQIGSSDEASSSSSSSPQQTTDRGPRNKKARSE